MAKRHKLLGLLAVACLAAVWAQSAYGSQLPAGFSDQVVFSGLKEPTAIRFAPNGPIYVAEKTGIILAYEGLGDTTPTVFADLRTEVNDSFDRGILGLAVDPNFPASPYLYVLYSYDHILGAPAGEVPKWGKVDQSGDGCEEKPSGTGVDACPVSGRLVRMTADVASGYEKAVSSGGKPEEKVLVEGWCTQFSSHSIGDLQFGAEGALYASGGEGGDANNVDYGKLGWPNKNQCGDPPAGLGGEEKPPSAEGGALRAQDARTPFNPLASNPDPTGLSGSVIRIDPKTGEGWPGNPLASSVDPNERRLIGYGFRNPFRFAIQPGTGTLYVDNVGWNTYEEIDRFKPSSTKAYNSGWPCYEGPAPQPGYQSLNLTLCQNLYAEPSATTAPFYYYSHGAGVYSTDTCPHTEGSAISGNVIYDGGVFPPEYEGAYFFADSVRGCIYVMRADKSGEPDPTTTTAFLTKAGKYPGIDLQVGPEGDLYYVSLFGEEAGNEFGLGAVHRIVYGANAPVARLTATPQSGGSPLEVTLNAGGSQDPNGKSLTYAWDLDGNGTFETSGGVQRTKTFSGTANVEVAVRVTNSSAESSVAKVTVYPGDTPPVPTIKAPEESLTWHVGQAIPFEGSAADKEDGGLGAKSLSWDARLFHCPQTASECHVHPLQSFPGTASGTLQAPDHDYPSRIELSLTATDSRGLSATKSIVLLPVEVDLQLASEPSGLTLNAGVASAVTPFTLPAIEDANVTLSAPLTQEVGSTTYTWQRWSDGGERVHSVTAAAPATYTAVYANVPPSSTNVAPLATATATSQATNQEAKKAIDTVISGYPKQPSAEWASVNGKAGTTLTLNWAKSYNLDHVVLYDRPNSDDQITSGKLTFSDGQSVNFGSLPNTGTPGLTVNFPAHPTTSLVMTATGVSTTTKNIGLSEIEAFGTATGSTGVAPAITSANAVSFTSGQAKSFSVTASGEPLPALTESGALPAGLGFKDNGNGTAALSGTAAAVGAPGSSQSYPLTLTATNGTGSANQQFTLTVVNGESPAPTANAGPAQSVASGASVTLDGSASSSGSGQPLTYKWTQTAGPAVTLSSATAEKPTFTAPTGPANLTFSLVVSDGSKSSAPSSVEIAVNAPVTSTNVAPLATATATSQAINQEAKKAIDTVISGYPKLPTAEWASVNGKAGTTLTLKWAKSYNLDHVVLYDRPNADDQITSGKLTFSDGQSVNFGALANAGTPGLTVSFPPHATTSLVMTATGVAATTKNIGLSEIEAFGN
jgi:glucose/arabinose dehydrogenase